MSATLTAREEQPFDKLRANGGGGWAALTPFVLSLSKHRSSSLLADGAAA